MPKKNARPSVSGCRQAGAPHERRSPFPMYSGPEESRRQCHARILAYRFQRHLIDVWRRRAILLRLVPGQIEEMAEVLDRPKVRRIAGSGRREGTPCPSRTMRPLRSSTSITPVELASLPTLSIKNTRARGSAAAGSQERGPFPRPVASEALRRAAEPSVTSPGDALERPRYTLRSLRAAGILTSTECS